MSKRTQSIRSMFAPSADDLLSADNKQPSLPRVASGAVRSLKDTFSDVERENEALRERLATGQSALEIDPQLIDSSPLADRFVEQDEASFKALKTSIRERGQEIPVLLRPHPTAEGRYQSAYGHRRVRAARDLGIQVKAHVRPLTDEELVVAQGIENSAREDLSFIERAVFALRLEDAGFERAVTQTALSVDRAEVSKLVAVARTLPDDIVQAIGRAPKIGRGRWQAMAEAVKESSSVDRVRALIARSEFKTRPSDDRFAAVLSAATKTPEEQGTARTVLVRAAMPDGREIAQMAKSAKQCKISLDRTKDEGFAEFVMRELPKLYQAYSEQENPEDEGRL